MGLPPHIRRRGRNPFDRAQLGIVVRRAERGPVGLKLTDARIKLMRAIADGKVKPGKGSHSAGYRWAGTTVTSRVAELVKARWATVSGGKVRLTDAGRAALDGAP